MKLHEAERKLNEIANIKFKDLFTAEDLQTIIVNKGKTGQLLELALGMKLSNKNRDFEDGELKTNKCDETGKPAETIFITQVSNMIDDLLQNKPFEETSLFEKIDNILYVPVCKVGEPTEWSFLESVHVNLNEERFFCLREQLHKDYDTICQLLNHHIETSKDGFIHTSNGKFIQIRSKDSKPYHPIYSNVYGREVSNKNHAFYFKTQFVGEIRRILGL